MKKKRYFILYALFLAIVLCFSACGGGSNSDQTGALSVGLADATSNDFLAVYITVEEVAVCQAMEEDDECEWIVVAEPNTTYNLLNLVNGVIENLGIAEDIEAGEYNQMRLVLAETLEAPAEESEEVVNIIGDTVHPFANYLVYGDVAAFDPEDPETFGVHELIIPSSYDSGFKIKGGFEVEEGGLTDIVLDFSVVDSIVYAGESGDWLLNPTVKLLDIDGTGDVSGLVYYIDEDADPTDIPIGGAIISAQADTDGDGNNIVKAATVSDVSGGYFLFLEPGTYTVAAIAAGYHTTVIDVTVEEGTTSEIDFEMEPAGEETGTIYGNVDIQGGLDDQFVTIKILDADGVVVASKTVANGGSYWFDLVPGTYSMVAVFTVDGEEMTLEAYEAFEVVGGQAEEFDILFANPDGEGDGTSEKVTICHKGKKTITISSAAVQAHLNHGDTEGACDEGEDEEVDDESETEETTGQIAVCHKGRTIYIDESALKAHLGHGDYEGVCED